MVKNKSKKIRADKTLGHRVVANAAESAAMGALYIFLTLVEVIAAVVGFSNGSPFAWLWMVFAIAFGAMSVFCFRNLRWYMRKVDEWGIKSRDEHVLDSLRGKWGDLS